MKTDCDIIQDLLPLYAEDHLSAKSRALVEEHPPSCAACQKGWHSSKRLTKPSFRHQTLSKDLNATCADTK